MATPDLDIFTETLDISNPDLIDCVAGLPGGPSVNPASAYAFAPMTAADLSALLAAGRTEAVLERARRGVGAIAPGVVQAAVPAQAGAEICVLAECWG